MTKRNTPSRQSADRADRAEQAWRQALDERERVRAAMAEQTPAYVEAAMAEHGLVTELVAWGRGQRVTPPPVSAIDEARRRKLREEEVQDDHVARVVAAGDRAGNLGAEAGQAAIEARAALRESAREAARRPRKPEVMARRRALIEQIRSDHPDWKDESVAFELADREGLEPDGAVGRMRRALLAKP